VNLVVVAVLGRGLSVACGRGSRAYEAVVRGVVAVEGSDFVYVGDVCLVGWVVAWFAGEPAVQDFG
jgi:hypothetical protein